MKQWWIVHLRQVNIKISFRSRIPICQIVHRTGTFFFATQDFLICFLLNNSFVTTMAWKINVSQHSAAKCHLLTAWVSFSKHHHSCLATIIFLCPRLTPVVKIRNPFSVPRPDVCAYIHDNEIGLIASFIFTISAVQPPAMKQGWQQQKSIAALAFASWQKMCCILKMHLIPRL